MKSIKATLFLLLPVLFCFLLIPIETFSQAAGLRFSGQEAVLDKRTSLDVGKLCPSKDFEISFDISFLPNQKDYFGYILRIINDKDQNVDLIYDQKRINAKNFKVIIGKEYSDIAFKLDSDALFKKWTTFSLKFNFSSRQLIFTFNGQQLTQDNALSESPGCMRLLFGANDYKQFKTTDLPAMNIRNIRIIEQGKLINHWPLNEIEGHTAEDKVSGAVATATNPGWIGSFHTQWILGKKVKVRGNASVAFNPTDGTLFIVGSDSLFKYSANDGTSLSLAYKQVHPLPVGNQAVYDIASRRLLNVYPDQKKVLFFNEKSRSWDSEFKYPTSLTEYWHANKFVSYSDSSLYIIGGYGQLKYKNAVVRYSMATKNWETLDVKGDSLAPRYLAGLGTNASGSTAYVIGGYGSQKGEQMLSPQNYYDLFRYDVKTSRFTRLYELKGIKQDFAFANSLVIDEKNRSFYGLIFQNNKYNAHLQLLKGALDHPSYELLADGIPYKFHDIESFADLFYYPAGGKLVAVTSEFSKANSTEVKVYTIDFPPEKLQKVEAEQGSELSVYIKVAALLSLCLLILFLWKRKSRLQHRDDIQVEARTEWQKEPIADPDSEMVVEPAMPQPVACRSSILLFGNLQVFDADQNDITRMFTPLLKELLLIIIIYTIRWERGVSSEKLNELLWFDKSEKDARNNRSVNMAKLRSILEKVGSCQISKETGYWKLLPVEGELFIDYQEYMNILRRKDSLDKELIEDLMKIIDRGTFLSNTDYEWVDDMKSEISNEIISILLRYAKTNGIERDTDFVIRLINYVFNFDLVNEEAMIIKCRSLVYLRKHSLAHRAFEKFKRDYKSLYGEDYAGTFQDVVESK